jgi:hypothetical protein
VKSVAEAKQPISRPDLSNFPGQGKFLHPIASYSKVFEAARALH